MLDRFLDWWDWHGVPMLISVFLLAVFGSTIYFAIRADYANEEAFMAECLKDHKHYECVAMYRGHAR
jgi:hypothetical protein